MRPQEAQALNGARLLDRKVIISPRQISCEIANEAVILNLEEGVYYGLNPVASRVWELVQEPRTIREIRDALLSEYEIEEHACTRDLLELLNQLRRCKLLELLDGERTSPS